MLFRQATNKDVPSIEKLIYSILLEYGLQPDPSDTDKDLKDIERYYLNRNGYFEVLELDGLVVGTWGLFPHTREHCELRKMYLSSAIRGQGHGKKMIERAMVKARELRFKTMELETASVLKEAIQLYTKYGFKPKEITPVASRCDQVFELEL